MLFKCGDITGVKGLKVEFLASFWDVVLIDLDLGSKKKALKNWPDLIE